MATRADEERALLCYLQRKFREVAFFIRVPLEDLALVYPEASTCRSKPEFLRPYVESLRALVCLALEDSPAEVGRLAHEYPEVGRLLVRRQEPWLLGGSQGS